jgi:RuvA, C-terminal domain
MKTNRRSAAPKTRPVLAALLVAATLFLLLGHRSGVLGALTAGLAQRLLGAAGTGLLCSTTWVIAFILATPPGTATRLVIALWHAFTVPSRHTVTAKTERVAKPTAAETFQISGPPLSPKDRRALDDIRSALKQLGYLKHEYEPIVAKMDPAANFEKNVKNALKALQVN